MKLIVGLGNPGAQYANTRHNVGFLVADRLAELLNVSIGKRNFKSLVGEGRFEGKKIMLMKPQTYMNLSGHSVRDAAAFHKIPPEDILVIFDDLNLDLGRIRIRPDGSHGGQNGIKSVMAEMGTDAIPRIRIGVGFPGGGGQFKDHVLGKWEKEELPIVREQVDRAAEAVQCILSEGIEAAMNRYNGK